MRSVLPATVIVWIPVSLFIMFGTRATDWMAGVQDWTHAHEQPSTFYSALVLGIVLVVEALYSLL